LDSISFFWSFLKCCRPCHCDRFDGRSHVFAKKVLLPIVGREQWELHDRVITTCHLGPKNSILLADVVGQVPVVGVSKPSNVILGTITDPGHWKNLRNLRLFRINSAPIPMSFPSYKSLFRNNKPVEKANEACNINTFCHDLCHITLLLAVSSLAATHPSPFPNVSLNIGGNADQGRLQRSFNFFSY